MVLEAFEALASWRLNLLINTESKNTEAIDKNKVIGTYTSRAIEDFDFIYDRLSIKLTDIEKQELIFLLFETVASIADDAETQTIDCSTIYAYKSITLPIRTKEVGIFSKWLYRHITTPEQYFMAITQVYHAHKITYYTIALLPNFQHRLNSSINLDEIYFATIADETRKEIFQYYYNCILKNVKDTNKVEDFFITYAHFIFIKLFYIFTMRSDFDDIEEARAYTRYVNNILQKVKQKYGIKQL